MNTTLTTLPLHHRGLWDVINMYPEGQANYWRDIVGFEKSTKELYEELAMFSGLGIASTMNESGGVPFDEMTTPYTKKFFLDIYSIGVELSPQAIAKDVYGALKPVGSLMGRSHYIALEQLCADIINNAQSASFTGIDGVALASASHPTASTTWSNLSTAAALSVGSIETMLEDLMGHQAYRDYVWPHVGPFKLVVPRQLTMEAKKIYLTIEQPGTANNDKNVARMSLSGISPNPFLTSSTRYALLPEKDNPIFLLGAGELTIWEERDARKPSHLYVSMRERSTGWTGAWGTQFNAGA